MLSGTLFMNLTILYCERRMLPSCDLAALPYSPEDPPTTSTGTAPPRLPSPLCPVLRSPAPSERMCDDRNVIMSYCQRWLMLSLLQDPRYPGDGVVRRMRVEPREPLPDEMILRGNEL
ncbi:hypothetical protein BV25DRAFT_940107 [Artomyces pyxidatus]|uniref:Uncharacterized protein n=1 Tax=Artomyces pyxidatus TaxID=48021 RepID=A0ACB8SWM1_9AGAM|nr:hypothetical protein BV25DRAFT_940107 [Artomyces pyxidatus]